MRRRWVRLPFDVFPFDHLSSRLWYIFVLMALIQANWTAVNVVLSKEWVVECIFVFRNYRQVFWEQIDELKAQLEGYSEERDHFRQLYYNEVTAHEQTKRELHQAISDRDRYHIALDKLSRQIQERHNAS